jgi:hypothetical protein
MPTMRIKSLVSSNRHVAHLCSWDSKDPKTAISKTETKVPKMIKMGKAVDKTRLQNGLQFELTLTPQQI